ncbi:MAG: hypothetical protein HKN13_04265 [Rhodothermales bacterium]|nr:hypothetical protein [Rhodothermales bacterium]
MKNLVPRFVLLSFVLAGLFSVSANAQDEYKEEYNKALEAQKAKNYTLAYTHYEKAAQMASAAGDESIAQKSHVMCAKLAKVNGTAQYKAEDYAGALATFEAGIAHEPKYMPNLYMKGLTQKAMGNTDEALGTFLAETKGSDNKTGRTAAKAIRSHFGAQASAIVSKENISGAEADQALALLDELQTKYEQTPDANSLFYRGLALKAKADYASCVNVMDSAVDIHRGGNTDKAKLFFTKGECLMMAGDNDAAKIAFGKAKFGSYAKPAQHFIETL